MKTQCLEDLTLLYYITAWKENVADKESVLRSWKGYSFDVIVQQENLLTFSTTKQLIEQKISHLKLFKPVQIL